YFKCVPHCLLRDVRLVNIASAPPANMVLKATLHQFDFPIVDHLEEEDGTVADKP
ncbi:Hypothetical protein FKW44_023008, partial [Caligus rogercresseyi]